jgi:hypothetical protein
MSCLINADNGVVSGFAGVRTTADGTGNLALQSNGVTLLTATTANTVVLGSGGITFSDNTTITSNAPPNVTTYTSGSGTYTTPTGAKWLQIEMCGGGGGGGGGGTTGATTGGAGANTTFGSSLLICTGGSGGTTAASSNYGFGGSATINSPATGLALSGGNGQGGAAYALSGFWAGAVGAVNPFGGSGGSANNNYGQSASSNTGAGGGGGGSNSNGGGYGGGGGAGGYIKAIISSPSSTYSYAVGAGGTASTAGTNGYPGGLGAAGVIFITAYF